MPYRSLPDQAFWKFCRSSENFATNLIYAPKFPITPDLGITTAGSCFAQNIGRYLRASEADLLDAEPAPEGLSANNQHRFGYGLYSGRYGNIYSAKQLMQLVEEVISQHARTDIVWEKDGRYYDALRPTVEPNGLTTTDEVLAQRQDHITRLKQLFTLTDIFIFTLGLTECWIEKPSGLALPTCPGVIAGKYNPDKHYFHNARYSEIYADLQVAFSHLKRLNPDMKLLLTVSPVPLTATATGGHALSATTYSKSTLRAVAGDLASDDKTIGYFPSYELITGAPFQAQFFEPNLRQVTQSGVDLVMSTFFSAHTDLQKTSPLKANLKKPRDNLSLDTAENEVCEDLLLEAFNK
jgi:hypothetical protein